MRMLQCAEHNTFRIEKLSVNDGDSHESHRSFQLLRESNFHTNNKTEQIKIQTKNKLTQKSV